MNGPVAVDWNPALLVLAAGLVLGTVLVWRVLGRARAAKAPTPEGGTLARRDLEGKRDALLLQLREIDDAGGKRSAEQLALERYDLELRAAQVLLALDATAVAAAGAADHSSSLPTTRPATAPPTTAAEPLAVPAGNAGLRGFLWGTLSASAIGLLFFFLYTQARPRTEGGSVTGNLPGPAPRGEGAAPGGSADPGPATAPGPEEAQLRERIASHPDDLEARMALARAALARRDMMTVWNETKAVLERSPGNAPALAYQALVRLAMGQGDKAEEMLRQALASDPNLVDAYVHLALVYARLGRMGEADKAIADATSRFPGQAAALQSLLANLKQNDAREDMAAVAGGDPHADPHASLDTPGGAGDRGPEPGGPPADGAGMAPGSQAPGGAGNAKRSLSGVVELDPALVGQVSASGILFVFVREAGFGAGPPVAARRIQVSSFPMGFEIGEEDAMMGQTFPDTLLVEARLDADGDPTTRPPTDPKARVDDVKAGSRTVRLLLKRP